MLLRQDGRAGRHAPDQRQRQVFGRQLRGIHHHQFGFSAQADAARGAADQINHAFLRQRLQVLLRGIGRLEAKRR